MSSITAIITELKSINTELKVLRLKLKALNNRKRECEKEILDFLEEKDQPGLKYQGMAIVPEEKETFKSKGKKQKEHDVRNLLQSYGIEDPEEAYKELLKTMKGSPKQDIKLKIKDIK